MNDDDIDPLDRNFTPESFAGAVGVRGKYFTRVSKGSNVVRLDPENARLFPTEEAVNQALSALAQISKGLGRRRSARNS